MQPNQTCSDIKTAAAQCLQELANVRQGIFDEKPNRVEYVTNFASNLIMLMQSENAMSVYLLKDRQLFKEFVKIPFKLELNFQLRDIAEGGPQLVESYIT